MSASNGMSNSNSFSDDETRTLPYWFRVAMPVPAILVGGL